MSTNKLMDFLCHVCSLLYNTGVADQCPEWVPAQFIQCPVEMTMRKLEYISPALYFCLLTRPNFLTEDRLGVDKKFYYMPAHIPTGESAFSIVLQARGR